MQVINLIQHTVNIYGKNRIKDGPFQSYPASGEVARLRAIERSVPLYSELGNGVTCWLVEYGELERVPQPSPGIIFIVSLVAALAARDTRDDLVTPYQKVRNEAGQIIGCRYLQKVC